MVRTVLVEANAGKVERVIEEAARKSTNKNECKEILSLCKNKQSAPFKKTAGLYLREVL
jgi:hypothetical protein